MPCGVLSPVGCCALAVVRGSESWTRWDGPEIGSPDASQLCLTPEPTFCPPLPTAGKTKHAFSYKLPSLLSGPVCSIEVRAPRGACLVSHAAVTTLQFLTILEKGAPTTTADLDPEWCGCSWPRCIPLVCLECACPVSQRHWKRILCPGLHPAAWHTGLRLYTACLSPPPARHGLRMPSASSECVDRAADQVRRSAPSWPASQGPGVSQGTASCCWCWWCGGDCSLLKVRRPQHWLCWLCSSFMVVGVPAALGPHLARGPGRWPGSCYGVCSH